MYQEMYDVIRERGAVTDDEQTVSYEHFLETNAQHSSDPTANTLQPIPADQLA